MGISGINIWVSIVLRLHIWFIMTVYYKMRQILLQNATANLLQNATEVYYKMRQVFYHEMQVLLQNATFITYCDSTILKYTFIKYWFTNHFSDVCNRCIELWCKEVFCLHITWTCFTRFGSNSCTTIVFKARYVFSFLDLFSLFLIKIMVRINASKRKLEKSRFVDVLKQLCKGNFFLPQRICLNFRKRTHEINFNNS